MKLHVFSIYDGKGRAFNMPYFANNENTGIRNFLALKKDPLSIVGQFPDDFSVYHLGSWTDESGQFELFDQPIRLEA